MRADSELAGNAWIDLMASFVLAATPEFPKYGGSFSLRSAEEAAPF